MGHPILRKKAHKVPFKDFRSIKKLVSDMKETLESIGASGLAAPQVLVNKRIIVYRVNNNRIPKNAGFDEVPWTVMINPVIKSLSKLKEFDEVPFLNKIEFCEFLIFKFDESVIF